MIICTLGKVLTPNLAIFVVRSRLRGYKMPNTNKIAKDVLKEDLNFSKITKGMKIVACSLMKDSCSSDLCQ